MLKKQKTMFVVMAVLVITIGLIVSFSFAKSSSDTKTISTNIHEVFLTEDINNLSLKIYYMPPSIETYMPLSVENLIESCERGNLSTWKFLVSGNELKPFIDSITAMDGHILTVINAKDSYVNARVYYVLESAKNGKLLEVLLVGAEGMLINDVHVEKNEYFYNFITPFLSEDAAADWLSPSGSPYAKSRFAE